MAQPASKRLSYSDYLLLEQRLQQRHEFLNGSAVAMAGGSLRHSALKTRLARLIGNQLEGGPCTPFDSDAKLRVLSTGFASYPDLSVVCGPVTVHPEDPHALSNPHMLVEVLSPTTEAWDRGEKFAQYRRIESLQHYLLVGCGTTRFEHYARSDEGLWVLREYGPEQTLRLDTLGIALPLQELYRGLPEAVS